MQTVLDQTAATRPFEHVRTLEALVARGVCTSVIATGPDGQAHWVQAGDVSTSTFPIGDVHHFGPVAIAEAQVELSQFDDVTGTIVLLMADGTCSSIQIVAQDVDMVIL